MNLRRRSLFALAIAGLLGPASVTASPRDHDVRVAQSASQPVAAGAVARPMPVTSTPIPPGIRIAVVQPATTFRWSDGDWIVRAHMTFTNVTGSTLSFGRDVLNAFAGGQAMTDWGPGGTLPEVITVAPGQSVTGDVAWYYHRTLPRPDHVVLTSGGLVAPSWRSPVRTIPGRDLGTPPPTPTPPTTPVIAPTHGLPPSVVLRVSGPGQTWRWSDGDWVVRVGITVSNASPATVVIEPSSFDASADGRPMNDWPAGVGSPGPTTIPPGQTATIAMAWYYNRAQHQPMHISVSTVEQPNFLDTVPVLLIPSPAP